MILRVVPKFARTSLFVLLLVVGVVQLRGAESNTLRLAVGQFFAPAGNDKLSQAGQLLPELLLAELSGSRRFQLLERDKVNAVWNEFHLTASGLVSRDTVAKLGSVLACDWLVTGSFAEAEGRTYIWTKVIDVRSGVVLDLNATQYESDSMTKSVAAIVSFLGSAGSQPKGRQFIAMGPFVNMNLLGEAQREDWTKRLSVLVEKHFLEAGFGVVEISAVGPIFEERRLETAGLTGNPEGRVKLQAAFWLVDGGCGWAENDPTKLSVGLRVQKIGGPEQLFRLTNFADEKTEKAVINAITSALANTNIVSQRSPNAEADLLAARAMEMATLSSPFQFRDGKKSNLTQWDIYKQSEDREKRVGENADAMIATYERTLLQDPENREAKGMLGRALLHNPDPAKRARGKELLGELVDLKDPKFATLAQWIVDTENKAAQREPVKRPDDWRSLNQAVAENPSDMEAKCSLGAALLTLPRASQRELGRKMLSEVVAGDRVDQAERARKLLAEPEKYPAIPDNALTPKPVAPPIVSTPPRNPEPVAPEDVGERARREFLQENFSKFVPVRFEKNGQRSALMQQLSVKENTFDYEGRHYCGFKFTTPFWMNGDLQWMHILAKTEAQKDFGSPSFKWYIIPKFGRMRGFETFSRGSVSGYKQLTQRFPHTKTVFIQSLPKEYLKPNQDYAIWFSFEENDLPDIAFALTIRSVRGDSQYGLLPLQ